jgi:hypothetical protein
MVLLRCLCASARNHKRKRGGVSKVHGFGADRRLRCIAHYPKEENSLANSLVRPRTRISLRLVISHVLASWKLDLISHLFMGADSGYVSEVHGLRRGSSEEIHCPARNSAAAI